MATIGEMIVKLVADTTGFNGQMEAAAAKVTASSDAMAASMSASMNAFRNFDNITKDSVKSVEGLATAQEALSAAQASGAFTTAELAAKESIVATAMKRVGSETAEATGALSMFTRNSRTMYSTSALITDAMTGQFSRMRREVAALGNETGLMARAFNFLVTPAGLAAIALAGVAVGAIEGAENAAKLTNALAATGGALGITDSQITQVRDGLIDADTSIGDATELVTKLALSGQFLGAELGDAARAAQNMAELTGESMSQAAAAVESLAKDPVKALQKLNSEFHFLTVPEAEEIAHLIQIGDKAGAAAAAIRDLANAEGERAAGAQQAEGYVGQAIDRWKGGVHTIENAIESWGAPKTLVQQFQEVQQQIQDTADEYHAKLSGVATYNEKLASTGLMDAGAQEQINADIKIRRGLLDQIYAQNEKATQQATGTAATTKQTNDIIAGAGKGSKHGSDMGQLEEAFKEQEAASHASYAKMKVDAADYWNQVATDSKNSASVRAAAWQKYTEAAHQLDAQGLAQQRQVSAEAKAAHEKDAQSALRALEEKRDATQQFSAQRMAMDAEIVAAAIKWYGNDSSAYRQAERQKIDDAKAAAKEMARAAKESAVTDASDAREIANAEIAGKRQAAQTEYAQGKISAGQLLQIQNQLVQEKLAAEIAYLKAKQAMDAGDVNAQKKDLAAIKVATIQAHTEESSNLARTLKQNENTWKEYTKRVQGMVASQVNAMIFQHQSLRAAVANIAESMAETWISNEIKQLMSTQAINAAKVAAKVTADQAQVASTAAAAAETRGIEQVANMKSITSAAASAAAKSFQALAGIPIVGPILGAIAAAATFVAVEAFGASAEGGWERVPAGGMVTQLHADEMVLPKHVADPIRNMARGGGNGGGATHVHIHAMDSRSFGDYLKRNPAAMRTALAHAGRNGW